MRSPLRACHSTDGPIQARKPFPDWPPPCRRYSQVPLVCEEFPSQEPPTLFPSSQREPQVRCLCRASVLLSKTITIGWWVVVTILRSLNYVWWQARVLDWSAQASREDVITAYHFEIIARRRHIE